MFSGVRIAAPSVDIPIVTERCAKLAFRFFELQCPCSRLATYLEDVGVGDELWLLPMMRRQERLAGEVRFPEEDKHHEQHRR